MGGALLASLLLLPRAVTALNCAGLYKIHALAWLLVLDGVAWKPSIIFASVADRFWIRWCLGCVVLSSVSWSGSGLVAMVG